MKRRSFVTAVVVSLSLLVGVGASPAQADLSKKVIAAFKGKILITRAPVEATGSDKDTIAHFKKTAVTSVEGAENGSEVWEWTFVYTGFLKSAGATTLKLEFYDGTKYVADQTLTNVDPKLTVVAGDIVMSEDDGLTRGKSYTLKLVGRVKGKDVIYAQSAKITMK
jgi:hypothetical protein